MSENTLPKDSTGKWMPAPRTATKSNQNWIANIDLVKDRTTHAIPAGVYAETIEKIWSKAGKEKFSPKDVNKLTISIIGYQTGKVIANTIDELSLARKFTLQGKIIDLISETNFGYKIKLDDNNKPVFWKFRRDYPETVNRKTRKGQYLRKSRRWSIALMVDMPGLATFYQKLEHLLIEATGKNVSLDIPVPHITLFVKGKSLAGIGIESEAMFNQCKVKRF